MIVQNNLGHSHFSELDIQHRFFDWANGQFRVVFIIVLVTLSYYVSPFLLPLES